MVSVSRAFPGHTSPSPIRRTGPASRPDEARPAAKGPDAGDGQRSFETASRLLAQQPAGRARRPGILGGGRPVVPCKACSSEAWMP